MRILASLRYILPYCWGFFFGFICLDLFLGLFEVVQFFIIFISFSPLDPDCRQYSTPSSHTNLKEEGVPRLSWRPTQGTQSSHAAWSVPKEKWEWLSSAFHIPCNICLPLVPWTLGRKISPVWRAIFTTWERWGSGQSLFRFSSIVLLSVFWSLFPWGPELWGCIASGW